MTEEAQAQPAAETEVKAAPSESLLDGVNAIDFSKGKPEGFPDDFWDEAKKAPVVEKIYESFNQQKARAEGLRQKLSKGQFEGKAPEDIKEYTYEVKEELKGMVKDDDPIMEAARIAAKDAGMPKEQFAKFISPIIEKLAEFQPKEPTEDEIKAYKAQELEKLGPSGIKVASSVKAFIDELGAKGVLAKEDVPVAQGMITTAEQLRVWNRMRSFMGGNADSVPVEATAGGSASRMELEAELVKAASSNNEALYNQIAQRLRKLA